MEVPEPTSVTESAVVWRLREDRAVRLDQVREDGVVVNNILTMNRKVNGVWETVRTYKPHLHGENAKLNAFIQVGADAIDALHTESAQDASQRFHNEVDDFLGPEA